MSDEAFEPPDIEALRAEIDEIDQQLMLLLGLRFRCTDQLDESLRALKQPRQVVPEQQRIEAIQGLALDAGVAPSLAVALMRAVAAEVAENQRRRDASKQH